MTVSQGFEDFEVTRKQTLGSKMLPSIPYTEKLPKLKKNETSTKIEIFSIVDDLIFTRKQKDPDLLKKLKALHQSTEIELKHIDSVFLKESEHDTNLDRHAPRGPASAAPTSKLEARMPGLLGSFCQKFGAPEKPLIGERP